MSAHQEALLLRRVAEHGGPLMIAGITECQAALALVDRGELFIVSGSITADGGSGVVAIPAPRAQVHGGYQHEPTGGGPTSHRSG